MLTVLMATHNGSDTIERTLAALSEVIPPAGGWKLVIVNNGSTDNTEKVISSWMSKLPIQYVVEPRLGRPIALNSGMNYVQGDFLVITDDDVLPERTWLAEWRRIADTYLDYSIFGGAVEPEFEIPPPEWLPVEWKNVFYAGTDQERPEGEMVARDIFGPNMAMRYEIVTQGARFDESLLVGLSGLLGDETDFFNRLALRGHRACFAPKARVRHIVQRTQVSWKWMLRRCYRIGRTMYLFDMHHTDFKGPRLFDCPRYLVRRIITSVLYTPVVALTFNQFRMFSHFRSIAYDLGLAYQARKMAG